MGTRKNLLENLRKSNGCTLSQEQIAIKMGLPEMCNRQPNSRHGDLVNKFETGETVSWDEKKFFRYCNVTNCDPSDVFAIRHPEEPYSKKFLEKKERMLMENNNTIIIEKKTNDRSIPLLLPDVMRKIGFKYNYLERSGKLYNKLADMVLELTTNNKTPEIRIAGKNTEKSITEDTCIIGNSGTGKSYYFVIPEIIAAMAENKNLFAILEKGADLDEILTYAKKTGHEVIVSSFPYNNINWFSSVDEPESISLLADSISDSVIDDDIDDFVIAFEKICKEYLWKDDVWHDSERHLLSCVCKYLRTLPSEEIKRIIGDKYSDKRLTELAFEIDKVLHSLSFNEILDADKLVNIFEKKHVIIFITDSFNRSPIPSVVLQQYMRILGNVKEYNKKWKDKREFEVIIDNLYSLPNLKGPRIIEWMKNEELSDIHFMFTISSIEQMMDRFNDDWKKIMNNIPCIYCLDIDRGWCSFNTEDYIVDRMDDVNTDYADNNVLSSTPSNVDMEYLMKSDSKAVLCIEKAKAPKLIFFIHNNLLNIIV